MDSANRALTTWLTELPFPCGSVEEDPACTSIQVAAVLKGIPSAWLHRLQHVFAGSVEAYSSIPFSEMLHREATHAIHIQKKLGVNVFDCVEGMSGKGALTLAFRRRGLRAVGLDRKYSIGQDILTPSGFRLVLPAVRRIRRGGLLWLGVECKSWTWIGRSQTGRSAHNPLGNDANSVVNQGNRVKDRVCILMLLAHLNGLRFVIEQPMSSILNVAPPMNMVLDKVEARTVTTQLGAFGGSSQKPLKLMGTATWLRDTKKVVKSTICKEKLATRRGSKVTGRMDALQESEHYPEELAAFIADLHASSLLSAGMGHS